MSEIQGLRSQFQALQMRRELSALRSDMLQAQSMLADAGSRLDDLPGEDASRQGSDLAGRTVEAGVVQNIPSILSSGRSPADFCRLFLATWVMLSGKITIEVKIVLCHLHNTCQLVPSYHRSRLR